MLSVRFTVLATPCSLTILQPNVPFIVAPGASADSFPDTEPFKFAAATYFLHMMSLMGTAITSLFLGQLSDKIGRHPWHLLCMAGSVLTLVGQYLARDAFWGFCAANFANGLFGSAIPVAMAYTSDVVHPNRAMKDQEIGTIVGYNVIGMLGGGAIAILMADQSLFTPMLVATGIDFCVLVCCYMFCIKPDKSIHFKEEVTGKDEDDEGPEQIDAKLFSNIVVCALLDNIGSSGLFPMALAPLAFNVSFADYSLTGKSLSCWKVPTNGSQCAWQSWSFQEQPFHSLFMLAL